MANRRWRAPLVLIGASSACVALLVVACCIGVKVGAPLGFKALTSIVGDTASPARVLFPTDLETEDGYAYHQVKYLRIDSDEAAPPIEVDATGAIAIGLRYQCEAFDTVTKLYLALGRTRDLACRDAEHLPMTDIAVNLLRGDPSNVDLSFHWPHTEHAAWVVGIYLRLRLAATTPASPDLPATDFPMTLSHVYRGSLPTDRTITVTLAAGAYYRVGVVCLDVLGAPPIRVTQDGVTVTCGRGITYLNDYYSYNHNFEVTVHVRFDSDDPSRIQPWSVGVYRS
jgi:hypothetical protein